MFRLCTKFEDNKLTGGSKPCWAMCTNSCNSTFPNTVSKKEFVPRVLFHAGTQQKHGGYKRSKNRLKESLIDEYNFLYLKNLFAIFPQNSKWLFSNERSPMSGPSMNRAVPLHRWIYLEIHDIQFFDMVQNRGLDEPHVMTISTSLNQVYMKKVTVTFGEK